MTVVAEIPTARSTDEAPVYNRPMATPAYLAEAQNDSPLPAKPPRADGDALRGAARIAGDRQQALGLPAVRPHGAHQHARAARAWAPASCASRERIARWPCRSTATAATAISIRIAGAMLAVAEAARNVACAGAEPIGATNCLNFGNPERPEIMWQFARAVEGITAACRRSTFRLPAATSASTTRPTAKRFIRRRCSASLA